MKKSDLIQLDLHYVDELIGAGETLHGGKRGAPAVHTNGQYKGAAINRSAIVMLSALLQGYVEGVFKSCAVEVFPTVTHNYKKYWDRTGSRWGNPSPENINNLFLRIGIDEVLKDLSWQHTPNKNIKLKLNRLNQLRNKIAHGAHALEVDGKPFRLKLHDVRVLRDFAENFAERFEGHVKKSMRGDTVTR